MNNCSRRRWSKNIDNSTTDHCPLILSTTVHNSRKYLNFGAKFWNRWSSPAEYRDWWDSRVAIFCEFDRKLSDTAVWLSSGWGRDAISRLLANLRWQPSASDLRRLPLLEKRSSPKLTGNPESYPVTRVSSCPEQSKRVCRSKAYLHWLWVIPSYFVPWNRYDVTPVVFAPIHSNLYEDSVTHPRPPRKWDAGWWSRFGVPQGVRDKYSRRQVWHALIFHWNRSPRMIFFLAIFENNLCFSSCRLGTVQLSYFCQNTGQWENWERLTKSDQTLYKFKPTNSLM